MQESILELKNISTYYGGLKALNGVSVTVRQGEIIALMGPNGAGKSTVLRTVFGLAVLHGGMIMWKGNTVKPITHEMVQRGVAFVPQGRRVFSQLTVQGNLELAGEVVRTPVSVKERIETVMHLFPELRKKRTARSGTLSGGQQQMLALGRGLMCEPELLLLDEPSLGLSPKIVKEVFTKIKEINSAKGMAIIVVEHNLKSLLEIVDRAYVLDKGKVVVEEKAENLQRGNRLQNILLGKV